MDSLLSYILKKTPANITKSFSMVGIVFSAQSTYEKLNPESPFFINLTFNVVLCLFLLSLFAFTLYDLSCIFIKKVKIGASARTISIRVGNILARKNCTILVGVNDTLNCDVNVIGQNSIHHQIIKKYYSSYGPNWIVDGFAREYQKCRNANLIDSDGHFKKFGYCFKLTSPDQKQDYIFIVSSKLHPGQSQTPITKTSDYEDIFNGLFQNINSFRCNDNRLFLSLIGTGAAGNDVNLSKLIEYISFRFIRTPSNQNAVHNLVIVIRPHKLLNGDIDLMSTYENIEKLATNCIPCPGDSSFLSVS